MERAPRAARHRADPAPSTQGVPGLRHQLTRSLVLTGLATAVTGAAVAAGVVSHGPAETAGATLASGLPAGATDQSVLDELEASRETVRASRSDQRTAIDKTKVEILAGEAKSGGQVTRTEDLGGGDPRSIARALLAQFGFSSDQFGCLDALWTKESGWNVYADNPSSSAYGIPQALPGSKMASAGADWATNPATQIRWGLGYISSRYGSPCSAWGHSQSHNWY